MRALRLHHQLVAAVLGAVAALTVAVVLLGLSIHEEAERTVWRTLLDTELDRVLAQPVGTPLALPSSLRLHDGARAPLPQGLQGKPPGLYEILEIDGHEAAALVRDIGARRVAMSLDITDFENTEERMTARIAGSALALGLLAALGLAAWLGRLLRPLDTLAAQIAALPRQADARLQVPPRATREVALLGEAFNTFLARQAEELERERAFLHTASHELRTPVAVVSGAAELARAQPGLPAPTQAALARIQATAARMTDLLEMLLVLARSPARVSALATPVDLPALVRDVVDDHRPLLDGRELDLTLALPGAPLQVTVPSELARVAVANLLRNAIEHSGAGTVQVRVLAPGTLEIDDPGQGLPPSRVAALYAQAARGDDVPNTGIGMPLLARLCTHLGWSLNVGEGPSGGTRARLVLSAPDA